MAQTKWVLVLMSVHDHRLNKPMVWDKSVRRRLNRQLGEERTDRLSSDLVQLSRILYFHAS